MDYLFGLPMFGYPRSYVYPKLPTLTEDELKAYNAWLEMSLAKAQQNALWSEDFSNHPRPTGDDSK